MWWVLVPILLILKCDCQSKDEKNLESMLKLLHETGDSQAQSYLNKLVENVMNRNISNINNLPNGTIHFVNKTKEIVSHNGTTSLKTVLQNKIEITKAKNDSNTNGATITTDVVTRSEFALNNTDQPIAKVQVPLSNGDTTNNTGNANIIIQVPVYIDMKGIIDKIQPRTFEDSNKKNDVGDTYSVNTERNGDIYENNEAIDKYYYEAKPAEDLNYNVHVFAIVSDNNEDFTDNVNNNYKEAPKEFYKNDNFYKPKLKQDEQYMDNVYYFSRDGLNGDNIQESLKTNEVVLPLFKKRNRHKNFDKIDNNKFSDSNVARVIRELLRKSRSQYQGI